MSILELVAEDHSSSLLAAGPEIPADAIVVSEAGTVKRDQAYYFDDGDCVFQVQDILFRVRVSLLSGGYGSE